MRRHADTSDISRRARESMQTPMPTVRVVRSIAPEMQSRQKRFIRLMRDVQIPLTQLMPQSAAQPPEMSREHGKARSSEGGAGCCRS